MNTPERSAHALFQTWYELEMPRIFRYICYRVRDRADAEELTSVVCMEAITHLDRYDPCQTNLGGWMFGLTRNVVARHFRSNSRRPQTVSLDSLPDIQCTGSDPEQVFELKEAFSEAIQHFNLLSEQELEVIALHYGAELSSRMIGGVMGIGEGHARVLLHRGLKTLRSAMRAGEKA